MQANMLGERMKKTFAMLISNLEAFENFLKALDINEFNGF